MEPKPCPLCGSTDLRVTNDPYGGENGGYVETIECGGCYVEFNSCSLTRFNKRVPIIIDYQQAKKAVDAFDSVYMGQDQEKMWAWCLENAI